MTKSTSSMRQMCHLQSQTEGWWSTLIASDSANAKPKPLREMLLQYSLHWVNVA